ncbi:MAG: PAS domain S-box protein [Verrucomicrobia bacterium]|nr:PAS domain S-box protein [Verrucomicrobiota bacterium]
MNVKNQIEILMLEDNPRDAELETRELRREGIQFNIKRVWTEAEFEAALQNPALDLILADYQLPSYDGLSALELAHKKCPKVPFIFVSGTLGEETAVDAMHHGATDYVLKQRLTRLGPSVRQAVRRAEEHKLLAQMSQRLAENEKRYRQLFGGIKSGVAVYEVRADGEEFVFKDFNTAAEQIEGVKKEQILGKNITEVFPNVRQMGLLEVFNRVWKTGVPEHHPAAIYRNDRGISWRENYVYKLSSGELVTVYDEVTDRKQAEEKLRLSEERLRLALDAGQMGAWEMDLVSGTTWRTLQHDQIFGYETPAPIWSYELLLEHVVPEDVELVKHSFAQALVTDRLSLECRVARTGQEPHWIAIQGHVSRNAKGERVRLMGTVSDISDRKLMEKALRESEQRFRLLADNASDLIWTRDASGQLNYVSPSVHRLLGYTQTEVLSRGTGHVLTAASSALAQKKLNEALPKLQAGKHVHETFELTYIRKDGWTVCCEVSCSGIFDASGKFSGIVGVSRDISERRRAEEALRESEERFRLATATARDAIIMLDNEGKVSFWNRAAEEMFGYSSSEALGQEAHALLAPERYQENSRKGFGAFRSTGKGGAVGKTLELSAMRKDGKEIPVEMSLSATQLKGRWHALAILRDITERKRVEEERMRLVTAVEQAAESVFITDTQGIILYVNPAFEKTTGYTREEAIGQNPRILESSKQDAMSNQQMCDTLSRGEVWHGRLTSKRKDGTFFEENATISPVRDGTGRIVNYIALKLDVTHELELESQLRQSQKLEAIGTLAGGIAHEINNPVNGIMNYAQLIADQLPADHPVRGYTGKIMKETDRVSLIVRNLLAFARQDKQGRSLSNLNDIISATLSLIQTVIRHDQINLVVEVSEGLPQMECRSQQIEQVLMNLLTNARDALNEKYPAYHEDKIIRVSARLFEKDGKPWIRTTIEDHGNGIPAEIRDRIFDPFYTTKPTGRGTGLGLSISHGLVEEHGGKLFLETEAGRYTRFYMDLPVKG